MNWRRIAANGLTVLVSLLAGLLLVELGLRWFRPIAIAAVQSDNARIDGQEPFVPDRTLGLRPVEPIADSNTILSKAGRPYKILFMGDSVTARGQMIVALAALRNSEATSYLNGGVESYNIEQEVEFFFRFQQHTRPDAIVHTWHVNDLRVTSLAHRNKDGTMMVHSRNAGTQNINPFLYDHSQLYRFLVARYHAGASQEQLRQGAFDALKRLKEHTQANGIAYHAVLFPVLLPLAKWQAYDRTSREQLLAISEQLGLDVVDLQPLAEAFHARGADPMDRPGDVWHPNQAFADEAVRLMVEKIPELGTAGR